MDRYVKVKAPFTPEQVASLNAYQEAGLMHPFTCGNDVHRGSWSLFATEDGWRCPLRYCFYVQDWAWGWMADWSWKRLDIGNDQEDSYGYLE